MSRNFELLQQLGEQEGVFSGLYVASPAPHGETEERNGNSAGDERVRGEIQRLVQTLFLSGEGAPHRVLFCGVDEREASGRLCTAAARMLANEVALPVCVVDGKLHAPSLQQFFHSDGFFSSHGNGSNRLHARQVDHNLWFIALQNVLLMSDSACGAEQLRSSLGEIGKAFAYVLIDAEPVGRQSDAVALAQATDGVVLVLEANSTRRVAALSAKETLETAGARLLGTVLNDRTFPVPETLYRRL